MRRLSYLKKGLSFVVTSVIIFLLILSGPAQAFSLSIDLSKYVAADDLDSISFLLSVDILNGENVPVEELNLNIDGPETINCKFFVNGSVVIGCDKIQIDLIDRKHYGYGYLNGEYNNVSNSWGYGYGYGYQAGLNGKVTFNLTLNTSGMTIGDYETIFRIVAGGDIFEKFGDDFKIVGYEPPSIFTIYSPNKTLSGSRRILVNLTTVDFFDLIQYKDYNYRNPKWKTLCKDCDRYGFERKRYKFLKEGENIFGFRAINASGVVEEQNRSVFVDSKKPIISRTEPRRNKVINGSYFSVRYTEEYLENITLVYGPDNRSVTKLTCEKGRNKVCVFNDINLSDYEDEYIEYYFIVKDKIWTKESRKTKVYVDSVKPEIDVIEPMNNKNYSYGTRRIPFSINVSEDVELKYIDLNSSRRWPRYKTLCRNCDSYGLNKNRFKIFGEGDHNILIKATDKAGNVNFEEVYFRILTLEDDKEAPGLTVYSPVNNSDNPRRVLFNVSMTEDAKLEYMDLTKKRPRFRRLCSSCDEYGFERRKLKTFPRRGDYQLLFRVTDKAGNNNTELVSFSVS